MFCIQENEHSQDDFTDPLSTSSDDEPSAKRLKITSCNLSLYQIPNFNTNNYSNTNFTSKFEVTKIDASKFSPNFSASKLDITKIDENNYDVTNFPKNTIGTPNNSYNTPKSLSIFTSTPTLPKFVNNPLNLANPLALASEANNIVKNLQTRFSLPAKLTITPVTKSPNTTQNGEVVRYKKNGEIAKKRGPPKGYKRKPKVDLSQSLNLGTALQTQNTILTSLLANSTPSGLTIKPAEPIVKPEPSPPPQIKVPEGVELVELQLDPQDWFPDEPYRMSFSRKKNPKWKLFPFRCEHCFKGYRVPATLIAHVSARHGACPRAASVPCPCCAHVSTSRSQHKKHVHTHAGRKHRIFCQYCLPPPDPNEPYVKESEKYPFDKFPQYWYASEESLRLHKKRKHPYAAMFNQNWFSNWTDHIANT